MPDLIGARKVTRLGIITRKYECKSSTFLASASFRCYLILLAVTYHRQIRRLKAAHVLVGRRPLLLIRDGVLPQAST